MSKEDQEVQTLVIKGCKPTIMEKIKIIKKISHGDIMYGIGNVVNNIVITLYGGKWLLDLSW